MSDEIRALIREVLAEELKALKTSGGGRAPKPQEETVEIASDRDLNAFALRVLDLAADDGAAAAIRDGRLRFRLQTAKMLSPAADQPAAGGNAVVFEKGLVSERQIASLPDGSVVRATPKVCFTPLARDEIRRKQIRLERIKP